MNTNFELYPGKTFQDACKDVYSNHTQRKSQLDSLITDLRKMCVKIDDLPTILPYIQECISAHNVNDEHLIRLIAVIQKLIVADEQVRAAGGNGGLTDEERKMILTEMNDIIDSDEAVVNIIETNK